jgi:hypothetical protein
MLPETRVATRTAHNNPFWRGIGLHSYDKIADQNGGYRVIAATSSCHHV